MLESHAQMDWEEAACRVRRAGVFSGWLKLMVARSIERPAVLAARDAAVLAAILRGRRNELATGDALVEPEGAGGQRRCAPREGPGLWVPIASAADAVRLTRRILRDDPRPRLVVLYLDGAQRSVGHTLVESCPRGFDAEIVQRILGVAQRLDAGWVALIEVTPRPQVSRVAEAHDLVKLVADAGAARGVRLRDYIRCTTTGVHYSLEEDGVA